MPDLQEGIAHAKGTRPGAFFAIIFLQAARDVAVGQIGDALTELWTVYDGLKAGRVPDLEPEVVPHDDDHLRVMLGFGPNIFDVEAVAEPPPAGFDGNLFRSPQGRGGPLLPGAGLHYAADVAANPATEHLCVHVTADTKLAVDRVVVETWKLLHDRIDAATGIAPLSITDFYLGFQRQDRRSWIDFHDGLSNLEAREREAAIAIKPANGDRPWCLGGTYLAFIRISVDLTAWRKLTRREQELLVGRDKLTGCPITELGPDGSTRTDPGCPVNRTPIWHDANDALFAEPPTTVGQPIAMSHVQRANHHDSRVEAPRSGRIFRQGYEFLEWQPGSPPFRLGLNFVSFQDTPARLLQILCSGGWLGGVNFGGDPDRQPPGMDRLLSVYAAGIYLLPPRGDPFPGASVFGAARARA